MNRRGCCAWLALALCGAIPAGAATADAARIVKITGQVDLRQGAGSWLPAHTGQELKAGDELHTGVDSEAALEFPGHSSMVVKELSDIGVATLLNQQGRVKVRVLLKLGESTARVQPKQAIPPDFSIQTPTATASIRGTEFKRIAYHPARGTEMLLLNGHGILRGVRGELQVAAGERASAPPGGGDLLPPREDNADRSRVGVEPLGLTRPERMQIQFGNQPGPAPRPPPMPPPPPPP